MTSEYNITDLPPQIAAKIRIADNGCWEWIGYTNKGYGRVMFCWKVSQAHRLVYELLVGSISPGLQADHLCRNKKCVNPAHLEPVTAQTNQLRGIGFPAINANKGACTNGHLFTPENTNLRVGRGGRYCKECLRLRTRAYRSGKSFAEVLLVAPPKKIGPQAKPPEPV